jgi:F-type H+-transporting ATPase subunit alpha
MALSLYAVNEGHLDDVPVEKVVDFESALHAHARANSADLLDQINSTGDYGDEIEKSLASVVADFKATGAY